MECVEKFICICKDFFGGTVLGQDELGEKKYEAWKERKQIQAIVLTS